MANPDVLSGDEAIKAYDSIDKDGAIFIQIWNNGNEAQSAPIPEKFKRSKSVLKQQEVYVVAEDWSWTFVSTHENGWLGPYFLRSKERLGEWIFVPDVTFPFKRWDNQSIENMRYDVEKISWEDIGFVVAVVSDEPQMDENKPRMQLVWNPSQIISYHVTDETYRSDCWGLDFQKQGRFFAVKESEYIDRFKKLSPLTPDELIHFTIVGKNTIVDLLIKEYPHINKS